MRKFEPVKRFQERWENEWIKSKVDLMGEVIFDKNLPRFLNDEYKERQEVDWILFIKNFMPRRATKHSAGYDMRSAENVIIEPFFKTLFKEVLSNNFNGDVSLTHLFKLFNKLQKMDIEELDEVDLFCDVKPTLVSTGLKVYMEEDEVLKIYNRSSNPIKKGLIIPNSVGIIDHDYADNPDNEGEIFFQFWNFGNDPVEINIGDRLGQGMFVKYLKTDDDDADGERMGGHGSTGHK